MASESPESHVSAASLVEHVAAPLDEATLAAVLKDGPRGALVLAGVSVGLIFVGWLLFYFFIFMPRGSVG